MDSKRRTDSEQGKSVRKGFGDEMGTRVGPADGATDGDRSVARLSEDADSRGLEGSILEASSSDESSQGKRSSTRADGSNMAGEPADRAPAKGTGAGAEGSESIQGAKVQRGNHEGSGDRAGSEPLSDRDKTHKSSYGGEGGQSRTSSDQRE